MPDLVPPVTQPGRLALEPQPDLSAAGGLVLSPWEAGDAAALRDLYADPAVQHWHHFRVDSDDEAREIIGRWRRAWSDESGAHWKVTQADGALAGRVALPSISLRQGSGMCLYSTVPAARGQGVAPRVLAAGCDWAFRQAGLHRIELRHSAGNQASCRVADKSGFPAEGTERGAELLADGWHDVHVHARIRS